MSVKVTKDARIYPVLLFHDAESGKVCVRFPDLPGCNTFGDDYEDALASAKDAIGGHLLCMEEDGDVIPVPSSIEKLCQEEGEVAALVMVRMDILRAKEANKSISKNVTLPSWLNQMAMEANINFSSILQDALKERLGV